MCLVSPLPGCVDDVSTVERDVDSLVVVVVAGVVVTVVVGAAAVKVSRIINKWDAPLIDQTIFNTCIVPETRSCIKLVN